MVALRWRHIVSLSYFIETNYVFFNVGTASLKIPTNTNNIF